VAIPQVQPEHQDGRPLAGVRVVEFATGIAGAYATKLLLGFGADVVMVEPPDGAPLRRWSQSGGRAPDADGALFGFLAAGKSSMVVDPASPATAAEVLDLVRGADVAVWSPGIVGDLPVLRPEALRSAAPGTTVLSLTAFGLEGPWADRPATEFTLQAWCGGIGARGAPTHPPVSVGGRSGEWIAGLYGAIAVLLSRMGGKAELLDASMLEALALTYTTYPVTWAAMAGRPWVTTRFTNIPGIHPTADGHVGLFTLTGQQWQDFCAMIERPDWGDDESLLHVVHRRARHAEIVGGINEWTRRRTTAEIVEIASLLRVPASALGNGATVTSFDHLVERGAFGTDPSGKVVHPRPPYILHGLDGPPDPQPAPRLGEHSEPSSVPRWNTARHGSGPDLPLAGVRVVDITSVWAGPLVSQVLAMFGADVIHVESARRPDAYRMMGTKPMSEDQWWEWTPMFHGPNTGKRSLAVDLGSDEGREVLGRLMASSDVVVENFAPRVLEAWGFGYDRFRALRPDGLLVRMPAFGLSGPWRDRIGYALTMEQMTGIAWVTGHPDVGPEAPNGVCDPIAALHALVAILVALEHRERTGQGMLVEAPMVGAALNVAAEQVLEWSAYGHLMERQGNRGPTAAPQNLYLCADEDRDGRRDRWIAVAVEEDAQWHALCGVLDRPDLAARADLATAGGRRIAHDELDDVLAGWCAGLDVADAVDRLWSAGVPVGQVLMPHEQETVPQLAARGFFEPVEHPVTGTAPHPGFPVRRSAAPRAWHRGPAPLLGQHNAQILAELGYDTARISELASAGVIADRVR
jgi:crotonobetainyl-CoA:carnitine CoA-transferase CaiB-like acyl-CoA transferase